MRIHIQRDYGTALTFTDKLCTSLMVVPHSGRDQSLHSRMEMMFEYLSSKDDSLVFGCFVIFLNCRNIANSCMHSLHSCMRGIFFVD